MGVGNTATVTELQEKSAFKPYVAYILKLNILRFEMLLLTFAFREIVKPSGTFLTEGSIEVF